MVKLDRRTCVRSSARLLESAADPADDDEVIFVDDEEPSANRSEAETGRVSEVSGYERPEESFASVIPDPYTGKLAAAAPLAVADDDDDDVIVLDDDDDMLTAEASRLGAITAPSGRPQGYAASLAPPPVASAPSFQPRPRPVHGPGPGRPAVSRPPAPESSPGELDDALEEIDFYLKQGSRKRHATRSRCAENFPDHPCCSRSFASRGESEAEAAPRRRLATPASAPTPPINRSTRTEAGEESRHPPLRDRPIEIADVLAAFKKGVAKQIDKGDTATHYDLGIAYMEMGLHAEAIDEFKICLADPTRRCTAHTMIGLSCVAKGDMEPALEHFKLALESDPTDEVECGLWFEMGNANELLGKNMEALVWYEKVEERNPTFRDVALRIERLGTARTPQQEADEFDEMFDNMIMKE